MSLLTPTPVPKAPLPVNGRKSVDLIFLLDRSGSMRKFERAVIRAFDRMLDQQKSVGGDVAFTLAQFATDLEMSIAFALTSTPPLAIMGYSPTGSGTALLDGIADTVSTVDERQRNAPRDVVVVIITDGEENCSDRATWEGVAVTVADRIARGWKFIFIGANQDAVHTAKRLGIPADCALTFAASTIGVGAAFRAASANLIAWRCGGVLAFNQEQRAEQRLLLAERNG